MGEITMTGMCRTSKTYLVFFQVLLFLFLSGTALLNGATPRFQDDLPAGLISIGKLRENLKQFLKNSKRDKDPEIQRAALFNLCQLHLWVVSDPRYAQSEALQGIRATAATRLRTWAGDYQLAKKRQSRKSENGTSSVASSASGSDDSKLTGDSSSNDNSQSETELLAAMQGYEWSGYSMGTASGGPSQIFNHLFGSSGPPWDHAEDLIALIEDTLDPDSWRKNGGTASIHYHRPQLALVVTATQEMHDRIYQLLWQLRAMN